MALFFNDSTKGGSKPSAQTKVVCRKMANGWANGYIMGNGGLVNVHEYFIHIMG